MRVVDRGHIVAEPDVLGGEPHIAGRRIGVSNIAVPIVYQGASPEDIADEFHTHASIFGSFTRAATNAARQRPADLRRLAPGFLVEPMILACGE